MDILRQVQLQINRLSLGLFANWPPNQNIEVGDFGVVAQYRFVRNGSLKSEGLNYEVQTFEGSKTSLEYTNHVDLKASVGASPGLKGIAKGTAKLTFESRGAFLFHLAGLGEQRLANQRDFIGGFARKYFSGEIPIAPDSVVVSEIHRAKKSSIVVSDSKGAHLELHGDFPIGQQAMLAQIKGDLSLVHSEGAMFKWLAAQETIPLLGLLRPTISGPGGTPIRPGILAKLRELLQGGRLHIREIMVSNEIFAAAPHQTASVTFSDGRQFEIRLLPIAAEEFLSLSIHSAKREIEDQNENESAAAIISEVKAVGKVLQPHRLPSLVREPPPEAGS